MIIGEAWGAEEERLGMPFVGASGQLLDELLEEAGLSRRDCHLTNVFNLRPKPKNDISNLCVPKKEDKLKLPPLAPALYLDQQYWPEVQRLFREIEAVRPNLILSLGNTPLWALTQQTGISKVRGTIMGTSLPGPVGFKLLPTFHPAALLREQKLRPVVVMDLMKAKRQAEFPEIRRPKREIWIEPELGTLQLFWDTHLARASEISFDIETAGDQITCIGFAPNKKVALVIPFVDNRKPNGSYWPTPQHEIKAWQFVQRCLAHPARKIAQNGLFDVHWLWRKVGMVPFNFGEDTMLRHHAMQPESQKGLGFLGSIYTDEPAWKLMNKSGGLKRED